MARGGHAQGKLGDARRNGSIVMKGFDGSEVARYNFTNAWPSKVTMGTLKAGSNEVLMEEVSIVTEALNRVVLGHGSAQARRWPGPPATPGYELRTEFPFILPRGYVDGDGHRPSRRA